jgi:hypothetical protein
LAKKIGEPASSRKLICIIREDREGALHCDVLVHIYIYIYMYVSTYCDGRGRRKVGLERGRKGSGREGKEGGRGADGRGGVAGGEGGKGSAAKLQASWRSRQGINKKEVASRRDVQNMCKV